MDDLIVFQGKVSQTGLATSKKFPDLSFPESRSSFDSILQKVSQEDKTAILPVWNSHVGEIAKSHVFSMLFEDKAFLFSLWPAKILFKYLSKPDTEMLTSKIISVHVVEQQCSKFLYDKKLTLVQKGSTTIALEEYLCDNENKYIGVLVAPENGDSRLQTIQEDVANPFNFTTFSVLVPNEKTLTPDFLKAFGFSEVEEYRAIYSAVQLPMSQFFSEPADNFFDQLAIDAEYFEDIPKVVFISNTDQNECRILFESEKEVLAPEILTEDGLDTDIYILPKVGKSPEIYSEAIKGFISSVYEIPSCDFNRHIGTKTCFYYCPTLEIITHGFDTEVTEQIVKKIIRIHFEAYISGVIYSAAQNLFFKKYMPDFQEHGIDFVQFTDIGL